MNSKSWTYQDFFLCYINLSFYSFSPEITMIKHGDKRRKSCILVDNVATLTEHNLFYIIKYVKRANTSIKLVNILIKITIVI